jgi:hypothetical protein
MSPQYHPKTLNAYSHGHHPPRAEIGNTAHYGGAFRESTDAAFAAPAGRTLARGETQASLALQVSLCATFGGKLESLK